MTAKERAMKSQILLGALLVCLFSMAIGVEAEVVYTPVNVVLPANGTFPIDFNHDGINDFTVQASVGLVWCQFGDGGYWKLTVQPGSSTAAVVASGGYAMALQSGISVGPTQSFGTGPQILTYMGWGRCGTLVLGPWLNSPDRYLGVAFAMDAGGSLQTHYGWVKLSDAAYVDPHGNLHAVTIVSGFAYESIPGRNIVTGQGSGSAPQ